MPNPVGHTVRCRCSGECIEHTRAYDREVRRAYTARDPERAREQKRDSYHRHADHARARRRAYVAENRDVINERKREYARENREILSTRGVEMQRERRKAARAQATRHYARWTELEIQVALDRRHTVVGAALLLNRTYSSIAEIRKKYRSE